MRALLDVNVLIALLDVKHVHHLTAMNWMRGNGVRRWASCPITQLGCIRVMSNPSYPNNLAPRDVAMRLAEATANELHEFWADDVNLLELEVIARSHILGSQQLMDVYLLALAVKNDGTLVTFDSRVPTGAVLGAESRRYLVLR